MEFVRAFRWRCLISTFFAGMIGLIDSSFRHEFLSAVKLSTNQTTQPECEQQKNTRKKAMAILPLPFNEKGKIAPQLFYS